MQNCILSAVDALAIYPRGTIPEPRGWSRVTNPSLFRNLLRGVTPVPEVQLDYGVLSVSVMVPRGSIKLGILIQKALFDFFCLGYAAMPGGREIEALMRPNEGL